MAAEDIEMDEGEARERHTGTTVLKWIGIVLGVLVLLIGAILIGLNTDAGRRFVVGQLNGLELESGLDIDIGELDGSLYGELTIRDLTLSDPEGVFLTAPLIELDWRPFAFISNHVDVRSAVAPEIRLLRLPALNETPRDPNQPLLPDIDIDIGRLEIGQFIVEPAVTGQRHIVGIEGTAHIADGRAQIEANAEALAAAGLVGGDRLVLRLDAVPEENRLDLNAQISAPADGLVASLAGLDAPLELTVGGEGDWASWQGRAEATLGGESLADLAITGRDGTFSVRGPLRPGLMLEGPAARLTEPALDVDLVATLDERRVDLELALRSGALAVQADGLVDLAEQRFGNLRINGRLIEPGLILENLNGRGIQFSLGLDGAMATPLVDYNVQAAAIGFGDIVVEQLSARGQGRVDADRIIVPIAASAARITGLNEAAGGLLTNIRIDGTFTMTGDRIATDDLRIRSDKLNASALVIADLSSGTYTGTLNGRVNDFAYPGIGRFDVTTDIELIAGAEGGFGLRGPVRIRTRALDNEGLRNFLGGNADIRATVSMTPEGVFGVDGLTVTAPALSIRDASGRFNPDNGAIRFSASGQSDQYGPFALTATGTLEAPVVRLTAPRPNVGIQLTDVEAVLRGTPAGYAVEAEGGSPYGPFSADLLVQVGEGPLAVDINAATFAGIDFTGRVSQTEAGPFAGAVRFSGSGVNGTVNLGSEGTFQRAVISARADQARIPGDTPITIGRAIIDATAVLYEDAPAITGDAQVADLRMGTFDIDEARANIDYRGGSGRVRLLAEGNSGVPFRIASTVALTPEQYRIAANGEVNSIPFELADPAMVEITETGYRLAPATIRLAQGDIQVAGRYGDGLQLQSRIEELDLAILNLFAPGAGFGGRLSGSLDFVQASSEAFPQADARIEIDDFTRSGAAIVSEPVDLSLAAALRPSGGDMNAAIRRGGNVIGRARVQLEPVAPGAGGWTDRLLAAPLGGGLRYNGPASVLWSLSGIADQQLTGQIAIAADFSGRVQQPRLQGIIRANQLAYENQTYGTRISDIALSGQFSNDSLVLESLTGRAGEGTVSASGRVGLASDAGFPIDINVELAGAQLAESDAVGAEVSGNISVTNGPNQPALISGELSIPEARYQIIRQGSEEIPELAGVRRRPIPLEEPGEQDEAAAAPPSIWNLDLRVRADNRIFVSGMGLESEWETDLRVTGTSNAPRVVGLVELIRGTFGFAGQRFELNEGIIQFEGGTELDPQINISASTDVEAVTAIINVTGSAFSPQISFSSTPALPQDEILSLLLFGGSPSELSATEAIQLAAALNSLRGSGGGLNPLSELRGATGFDRLRILGADEATGRGTALAAGQYISDDIYLEVITDARGFTATQLEISLSRTLSLLSSASSFGGSNVNLRYSKDY